MKTILLTILLGTPIVTYAQEPTIPHVWATAYHLDLVNGQVVYILDTFHYPALYTTQREKDSIRILDFRDLLTMDHLWLSHNVWRNDSDNGIYRRVRIARNEVNLHQADSAFTVQYGYRYTAVNR
jgi:hypothetical protein